MISATDHSLYSNETLVFSRSAQSLKHLDGNTSKRLSSLLLLYMLFAIRQLQVIPQIFYSTSHFTMMLTLLIIHTYTPCVDTLVFFLLNRKRVVGKKAFFVRGFY